MPWWLIAMCMIATTLAWWVAYWGYRYTIGPTRHLLSILGALSVSGGVMAVVWRQSRP